MPSCRLNDTANKNLLNSLNMSSTFRPPWQSNFTQPQKKLPELDMNYLRNHFNLIRKKRDMHTKAAEVKKDKL